MTSAQPHHQNNKSQTGFTLIELVVVTFTLGLIVMALFSVFDWHNRIFGLEQAEVNSTGSARASMVSLNLYLSQAAQIVDSATVNSTLYTTDADTIAFRIPSIDSSNDIIPTVYDTVVYYLDGANLIQLVDADASSDRADSTKQLSNAVSSLTFTYNESVKVDVTSVEVDMTITSDGGRNVDVETSLNDTIYLRNR